MRGGTDEGTAFFKAHCAGRAGHELMFGREIEPRKTTERAKLKQPTKSPWKTAEQSRPMREANKRAKLKPSISFHGLRHTWASHAVMNGLPLIIIAKNLGHKDTRMVEKHYGHLAPSYVADAIRAGAPRFASNMAVVPPCINTLVRCKGLVRPDGYETARAILRISTSIPIHGSLRPRKSRGRGGRNGFAGWTLTPPLSELRHPFCQTPMAACPPMVRHPGLMFSKPNRWTRLIPSLPTPHLPVI